MILLYDCLSYMIHQIISRRNTRVKKWSTYMPSRRAPYVTSELVQQHNGMLVSTKQYVLVGETQCGGGFSLFTRSS